MSRTRNIALKVLIAGLFLSGVLLARSGEARELKISHQFTEADARNALAVEFAKRVEKQTKGELTFKVFPSSALFKAGAQYDAMAKGALDLSIFPLAYASGKIPELEITLMPCIISDVDQGMAWKNKAIGKKVAKICEDKGMKILTWLWYGGGIGSQKKPVILPQDAQGLKFRAAGKFFEHLLNTQGASITSMASSEIYMALQTKVLDACMTSAESFISYRLYEQLEYFNSPENYSVWYMGEPLVISTKTWNSLTPGQQKIVETVGVELEKMSRDDAVAANKEVSKVFKEKNIKVHLMTKDEWQIWRKLAEKTAWKRFATEVPGGKELLDLAK
ncbi:MAG: C4-dicarboxylate ABC transporter [Desulfobacteraceae bacterium]|jgi:TRAP-type C4-dicarboxylate transport system substrate-binding protein|nr:MAG: C4-dicarboxylate ABC transporter [Desulfobacteraceae bacterium]